MGNPVVHSRSPAIFQAAFAAAGIEGEYHARLVEADGVRACFDEVRRGFLDGFNITMPHKALAASLCDRLEPEAEAAGSVNTVVREKDVLVGHSTDIAAVRDCWRSLPPEGPVLILGAGGAAAATAVALNGRRQGSLYIASRTFGHGSSLAERLGIELGEVHWGVPVVMATVVNCTPIGMEGEVLPAEVLALASGLLDMPYRASPTPAVATARDLGLPVVDGLDLLVTQAGHAFRLWTGMEPPIQAMRQAVENP
ncbi:MAG TPA: shikimate dehydrogenase [Acidimicrobiia bacterium]|nr:shikimate dehydrogenase [Acidimicrobiia bacterium]